MADVAHVEVKEADTNQKPVYLFDPTTQHADPLFQVVGKEPTGRNQFSPVEILDNFPPKSILEITTTSTKAYYRPVEDKHLIARAKDYLSRTAVAIKKEPLFVTFLTPRERESLLSLGYRIVRGLGS